MQRVGVFVVLVLVTAAFVWWITSDNGTQPQASTPQADESQREPYLKPGPPKPLLEVSEPPPPALVDKGVARAERNLARVRAALDASVATPTDMAGAERRLWLAKLGGGVASQVEAYRAIAKLDQQMLAVEQSRFDNGKSDPGRLWNARVRWHQSKRKAGDADEQYEELRAAYVAFVEQDHADRVGASVADPRELPGRIWMLCREFPLDPVARDTVAQRAGAGLRDLLADQLAALPEGAGEQRDTIELKLWSIRAEIHDVDARTAHGERARIYERMLDALERQRESRVGPEVTETQVGAVRVALHRERFAAGDENSEYATQRVGYFQAERRRMQPLLDGGFLSAHEYDEALERLETDFPPPSAVRPVGEAD